MNKKQPSKGKDEAIAEVRDFYEKTRRYDEEHGRETPVIHLGEKSEFDLKSEEGRKVYEMARYSSEATDELGRKSRSRLFSIPVPWKR